MTNLKPIAVVQDEIYGSIMTLHLCEQDSYLEYISRFDVMKKLHDTAKNSGLAVQIKDSRTGRIWYSVWMKEFDITNNMHQSMFMHEVNHVAMFTIFGARINITMENQEPFAHLAQFYYHKTTDILQKKWEILRKKATAKATDAVLDHSSFSEGLSGDKVDTGDVLDSDHATHAPSVQCICSTCKHRYFLRRNKFKCGYNLREFDEVTGKRCDEGSSIRCCMWRAEGPIEPECKSEGK